MIEHVAIPEERLRVLGRVRGLKERLKDFLNVDVDISEDVTIDGDSLQVIRAKEIIKAFGRGFNFEDCLTLLDDEFFLEVMNIKEFSGKSNKRQAVLKGRLIGKGGVTKKMIEKSIDVKMAIYGKTVSIIGRPKSIKLAVDAVEMILFGNKHNSVYRFLQEKRVV